MPEMIAGNGLCRSLSYTERFLGCKAEAYRLQSISLSSEAELGLV